MIRQVKVARDTAVKARTSAIITLKQVVVNEPVELREQLAGLGDKTLLARCAGFRVTKLTDLTASAKWALRSFARRWQALDAEITAADSHLDELTTAVAPTLRQVFGVGPDTAAEMLIVLGDNPDRVRSEAAFAKLCGVCPIPTGSGTTDAGTALAVRRPVLVQLKEADDIAALAERGGEAPSALIRRCLEAHLPPI